MRSLNSHAIRVLHSPALRAAAMLTAGGVGYVLANLLLARLMDAEAFGQIALVLALVQLSMGFGPLGTELSINRNRLGPSLRLASWMISSSLLAAVTMATLATWFYGLPHPITLCIAIAAMAASLNRVGCAFLQSQQRFTTSLVLGQIHNYVLLLAVPTLLILNSRDALPAAILMACSYTGCAAVSWYLSATPSASGTSHVPTSRIVKESLAGLGIALASQVLWQLERLVIPRVLSLEDLATFAVVAAIAASPFRMLQNGVAHTLLPRLRVSANKTDAKRLIRHEGAVVIAVAALATIAVFAVAPFIAKSFLSDRYEVSASLLIAVVVTGLLKVGYGFANAAVQAFGTTRTLVTINVVNWISVFASIAGAIYGARFGIAGVVYGGGIGWLAMVVVTSVLAVVRLRAHFDSPPSVNHARAVRAQTRSPHAEDRSG